MTTTLSHSSEARVPTGKASSYLQQLCKHFAHKVPATFDPHAGQLTFPFGDCRLQAEEGALHLSVAAADAEQLARMQDVVGGHLQRFAFREELTVDWQPIPA